MPEFVAAGAGAQSVGAFSIDVPYPSGILAGNLLVLHHVARDSVNTPAENIPSGWSSLAFAAVDIGLSWSFTYYKVATGSESGNLTITTDANDTCNAARMYCFKYTRASGTPYEGLATGADNTADIILDQTSVTTLSENRLCVHIAGAHNNTTVAAFTGETGGNFTEPVAEYSATGGTLQIQTAQMVVAGTISGGTAAIGTSSKDTRVAMALLPQ